MKEKFIKLTTWGSAHNDGHCEIIIKVRKIVCIRDIKMGNRREVITRGGIFTVHETVEEIKKLCGIVI